MTEYTPQSITQNRGPVIEFHGRELDEFTTQKPNQPGRAWTEVTLWETRGGNWVLEVINCSDREGQQDFPDAHVLDQPDMQERIFAAMEIMGWSGYARKMAKRLGWSLVREVA